MSDRWSDARLDDRFRELEQRVSKINGMPARLDVLEEKLINLRFRLEQSMTATAELGSKLDARLEAQVQERRSNLRWVIASGISSTGIVIAAMALLVDKI